MGEKKNFVESISKYKTGKSVKIHMVDDHKTS